MTEKKTAFKHIANACIYSFSGIKATYNSEIAFRQDIAICCVLLLFTMLLPVTFIIKILMIMSLFIILIAELINTAIETVIDRISNDIHPLSKKAKDIGSAIVFFSFIQMIFVFLSAIVLAIK